MSRILKGEDISADVKIIEQRTVTKDGDKFDNFLLEVETLGRRAGARMAARGYLIKEFGLSPVVFVINDVDVIDEPGFSSEGTYRVRVRQLR